MQINLQGGYKHLVNIVLGLYAILEIAVIIYIALWIRRGY